MRAKIVLAGANADEIDWPTLKGGPGGGLETSKPRGNGTQGDRGGRIGRRTKEGARAGRTSQTLKGVDRRGSGGSNGPQLRSGGCSRFPKGYRPENLGLQGPGDSVRMS